MLGADPIAERGLATTPDKTLRAVEEAALVPRCRSDSPFGSKNIVAYWATFFLDDAACVLPIVVRMHGLIVSEDEYRRRILLSGFPAFAG